MGDFVSQLRPALHRLRDWPYPDEIDHELFRAYMKVSHDVGGEPDAPAVFEEKEEEQWELNAFITCEVLGWKGIWTSEERRRLADVDVGRTMYLGLPYYGRWMWASARCLIDKHHITLTEFHRAGQRGPRTLRCRRQTSAGSPAARARGRERGRPEQPSPRGDR
jgi:hypothetical protein